MYIDRYYINKITDAKYPNGINQYGITEKAAINFLKRFRKNLSVNDVIEILEYGNGNNKRFIINIIENLSYNIELKKDDLRRISDSFSNIRDFIKFVNSISNEEIFVGGDLEKKIKWNMKFDDILDCRSYKIWSITND